MKLQVKKLQDLHFGTSAEGSRNFSGDLSKRKRKRKRFIPPTIDEVRAHVAAKGYTFDPETFHAYYDSQEWKKANGQPVSSWKGCCVTFQKSEPARPSTTTADDWHGMWSRHDETLNWDDPRWGEYTNAMMEWQDAAPRPSFEAWVASPASAFVGE